jgi:CheY-like chemotaxis protein
MPIRKVLAVDDVLTGRAKLQNILLDAGYQVSVATCRRPPPARQAVVFASCLSEKQRRAGVTTA